MLYCTLLRRLCHHRAKREMEGADPASSSRRSLGQALALDIKLAEEERRRLEAQRQHRQLQYAVAQPLPDEAPVAPGKSSCCIAACLPSQRCAGAAMVAMFPRTLTLCDISSAPSNDCQGLPCGLS